MAGMPWDIVKKRKENNLDTGIMRQQVRYSFDASWCVGALFLMDQNTFGISSSHKRHCRSPKVL